MPESDDAYQILANGLYGSGESLDAVRSALQLRWQLVSPEHRRGYEAEDTAALDLLAGDFQSALAHYKELDAAVATDPEEYDHFRSAYGRMLVNLELGRSAEAASIGREYLQRRSAWSASTFDPALAMWITALEYVAGGISRTELDVRRAVWSENHGDGTGELSPGYVWTVAYAGAVTTPKDADDALAALPPVRPILSAKEMTPDMAARVGHAYVVGGRVDEALPLLRAVTSGCSAVRRFLPVYTTWAYFDLGQALEAKGDVSAACDAYGHVLSRWGNTPGSRTATKARARTNALACARPSGH
jgi:tetratricopeptide (TPR) repeat protein